LRKGIFVQRNIVFWQNFPSPHQSAFIRSLAEQPDWRITLVWQSDIPPWREKSGWEQPDFGKAALVLSPDEHMISRLLSMSPGHSVHVFSGTRGYPLVWHALQRAVDTNVQIGLYAETAWWTGVKGRLRLWRCNLDRLRFGRRIDFILAVGHLGMRWFRWCGYPEEKLFPFGYFVERPLIINLADSLVNSNSQDQTFNIISVGRCVRLKGLDILLSAVRDLNDTMWNLKIVGDGPERNRLETLARRLGLSERVHFYGALSNRETMRLLETQDLLVLPSRMDGWGAVVNEALMRGVPVVCSDLAGAADLLHDSERGSVFRSESTSSLAAVLSQRIAAGKLSPATRLRIKNWAQAITGEAAAAYFLDIVRSRREGKSKPVAPWL